MKNKLFFLCLALLAFSCKKNENNTPQKEEEREEIYYIFHKDKVDRYHLSYKEFTYKNNNVNDIVSIDYEYSVETFDKEKNQYTGQQAPFQFIFKPKSENSAFTIIKTGYPDAHGNANLGYLRVGDWQNNIFKIENVMRFEKTITVKELRELSKKSSK